LIFGTATTASPFWCFKVSYRTTTKSLRTNGGGSNNAAVPAVEIVSYGSIRMDGLRHRPHSDSSNAGNNEESNAGSLEPLLESQQSPHDIHDPLLQPPSHHTRDATVTNIAEVYRLVLEGANATIVQPVAAVLRNTGNEDDDDENEDDSNNTNSSSTLSVLAGAVANLCSATLGAGVLALPYALREAGLVVGSLLLLGSALATVSSIRLLVRALDYYPMCHSYETLAEHVVSKRCRAAVEAALLVFCGGCAVAYTIAVGDILEQSDLLLRGSRSLSMVAAWSVAMLPLSMLRYMRSLQFASTVGIAAIGTLAFSALVHLWTAPADGDDAAEQPAVVHLSDFLWPANGAVSVMTAAPVVLFAFSCQTNVCAIYDEMVVPTDNNSTEIIAKEALMRRVTITAVCICALLYSSVSTIALADFGPDVRPNMLSNYHNAGQIMQVATAAMAFAVVMAFPLNIFPARVTLIGLLEKGAPARSSSSGDLLPTVMIAGGGSGAAIDENLTEALLPEDGTEKDAQDTSAGGAKTETNGHDRYQDTVTAAAGAEGENEHHIAPLQLQQEAGTTASSSGGEENFNLQLHVATTLFLTGMALGLALVLPNISVVFGLLGGTASSMIGFCVPGLLGLQMCQDIRAETGERQLGTVIVSWLLLGGGVAAGIFTTIITAYNIFYAPAAV